MTIEVKSVTKVLRKITVLEDVNLILESGTIYGLRGVNGSGKTMLMRLMAGLIRPTKGKVLLDGRRLGEELSFPSMENSWGRIYPFLQTWGCSLKTPRF